MVVETGIEHILTPVTHNFKLESIRDCSQGAISTVIFFNHNSCAVWDLVSLVHHVNTYIDIL